MKRVNYVLAIVALAVNCMFAQTWDVLDKSMADYAGEPAWNVSRGGSFKVTQKEGYVNVVNEPTDGKWGWLKPETPFPNLEANTPYSIEVKARLNSSVTKPGNQIALRLKDENVLMPFYLAYGEEGIGYISASKYGTGAVHTKTSEFRVYGILVHADHATYDVYVDGELALENVGKSGDKNSDPNGVYFGAASNADCDMDVEYVKMGKGNFFAPREITSVFLSQSMQAAGVETTVTVTANVAGFQDGEKLNVSLVDGAGVEVVAAVEATVNQFIATTDLVIPETVAEGTYSVKVAAGDISLSMPYQVLDSETAKWNILNRDFTEIPWNGEGETWILSYNKNNVSADFAQQRESGVNLNKTQAAKSGYYAFLQSPVLTMPADKEYTYQVRARITPIDKEQFPDETELYEANQIAFQQAGKMMPIFLIPGYVTSWSRQQGSTGCDPSTEVRRELNTSEWHDYSLVASADRMTFDVYVDDRLYFEGQEWLGGKGQDAMVKLGGESWQRINMDVQYVRLGEGNLMAGGATGVESTAAASELAVSRTVLHAGESVSVAANGEVRLSEAVFYSLTGKEMSRTAVDAYAASLQVPATPGMYILRVILDDHTAKEFKVLVK